MIAVKMHVILSFWEENKLRTEILYANTFYITGCQKQNKNIWSTSRTIMNGFAYIDTGSYRYLGDNVFLKMCEFSTGQIMTQHSAKNKFQHAGVVSSATLACKESLISTLSKNFLPRN
jgi:hypothetical protein